MVANTLPLLPEPALGRSAAEDRVAQVRRTVEPSSRRAGKNGAFENEQRAGDGEEAVAESLHPGDAKSTVGPVVLGR